MPRADFLDALRGIADKHKLEFRSLSEDWIIQLLDKQTGRQCSVFGYTFDINGAAAVEICKEKAATSLVLESHAVPHIPHRVFLSPANPFTAPYVGQAGVWAGIQALVAEWGFPVVVKPLKGTGGLDVMKATCWRDVEGAVQHIFGREYGLAVSPYKKVVDEYRCILLDGVVQVVYRKVRKSVVGDGARSVGALLAECMAASPPKDMSALAAAGGELSVEELALVPAVGEAVAVQWKHNLGGGASVDMDVPAAKAEELAGVAVKAATAIGIRFCSVDVVDVGVEGLMIMEVNSGVMMDSLMGLLGERGVALASQIYEAAVVKALCIG